MRLLIQHATVQYGATVILDNINFEIHDNEKIAVVGRNGCGKTTLLKFICGELSASNPDSDEEFLFQLAGRQRIGYLNQINFPDKNRTAKAELLTAVDATDGYVEEWEMNSMWQKFGFSLNELDKPIGNFSGGQQTKIAFMKLLVSQPEILLLDEPTNHLDLPAIEWLEGFLKRYKKAVVVISHDREFLDYVTTVTYEIEYNRMKRYSGNYTAFVRQKEEALLKQTKDYEAQQKEIKRLTEWVEKWKNTPTKVTAAHSKLKAIEHMEKIDKPQRFDTATFHTHYQPRIESWTEVLNLRDLEIGYDAPLCKVSFTLEKRERMAIIGPNGVGKSTLLKTVMGMVPALGGTYRIGNNVEVGYFDQETALEMTADGDSTVLQNFWDAYPKLTNGEVRSALGAFVFSQEEVEKQIRQLSGGERVRLALCKMLYARPNFLILDEPTNHMDMLGKESLAQILNAYGGTVLFVSHDRYFIKQVATRVVMLDREEPAKVTAAADLPEKEIIPEVIKNPGKVRSRLERQVDKLHKEIASSEKRVLELKESMADPGVASDYEKLWELQGQLDEEDARQEELLAQLLETEEELASIAVT